MPSASSCFLLFLHFRKSLKEIFLELDENLRRLFLRQDEYRDRRATWGATQGPQAGACRGPLDPWEGAAPAPWAPPRPPLMPIKSQLT